MKVKCSLCPKHCIISPGQSGECRIRINLDGKLKAVVHSYPVAIHLDPIEKKPLFHFLPGSKILSIATVGCNLHCKNCQNWEISQANPEETNAHYIPPNKLVEITLQSKSRSIAYTYTDPIAYYEYTLDASIKAKEKKLKNVLVTAGYINSKPLKKLLNYVDAANIDLKAFSDKFYRNISQGTLKPVLRSIVLAKEMGVHVEITNLLIPTLNDSKKMIKKLVSWIYKNLGPNVPLHFSRFYPHYKMRNLPPTSSDTLEMARSMALDIGLNFVYIGNLYSEEGENTYCPKCKKLLIERTGYKIMENYLTNGRCSFCHHPLEGIWTEEPL